MGANATTFVPAYVSGEVLTAADLTVTNSGIPVFADSTARDAAFGGTGEKVLAEGQYAYLESTNATQFYDGAVWQPVGTAPGLVYITGATFTAASTIIADGCFTSTYRNYKIFIDGTSTTGEPELRWYFRTSGVDNTGSSYVNGQMYGNSSSAATAGYQNNVTSGTGGWAGNLGFSSEITIFAPQAVEKTKYVANFVSFSNAVARFGTANGFFSTTTQFDGIKIFPSSSDSTGQYRIYGVANS